MVEVIEGALYLGQQMSVTRAYSEERNVKLSGTICLL